VATVRPSPPTWGSNGGRKRPPSLPQLAQTLAAIPGTWVVLTFGARHVVADREGGDPDLNRWPTSVLQ